MFYLGAPRRRLYGLTPFLFVLALFASDLEPAFAQTVSLDTQSVRIRRKDERRSSEDPDAINRKDCLDDDPTLEDYDYVDKTGDRTWMQIAVSLDAIPKNAVLEVWASRGADCATQTERQPDGNCRIVYRNGDVRQAGLVDVAVVRPRIVIDRINVDDLNGYPDNIPVADYPAASVCDSGMEDAFTFYVMLFSGDSILSQDTWTGTLIDIAAPDPPSTFDAVPGDQNIFLDWEIPSEEEEDDTDGFVFYCAPATGAAGGAGGASGGCGQNILVEGEFPPNDSTYECGEARGRTARKGQITSVDNGTLYAVAMSSKDLIANPGLLSEVQCVTPQEVDTFFENYKNAGGRGGGGFCSQAPHAPTSLLTLMLSALGLSILRRRRGRSS